jgi:hypothetical protein
VRQRSAARTLASLLLLPGLLGLPSLLGPSTARGGTADETASEPDPAPREDEADLDELLGGFDDEGDDLLGGFDDDFDAASIGTSEDAPPAWLAALPFGETLYERVDLGGSLTLGAVYAYLDHKVPHGDEVGRSTNWSNLTRLDLDGLLRVDVRLPRDWTARAELVGWYDFVYRIKGRGNYGGAVLDVYEWQVDSGEAYVSGPLHPNLDLTVGRKIVNWGRSDTFRVVDVVNPLDNKEPGLVDIEDLRRPVTMLKLDAISGPWSAQLLVVPEFRYDRNPPIGSDFFPKVPRPTALVLVAPIDDRDDFADVPEIAGRFDGRFSGWDFSLFGAYVDDTERAIDRRGPFGFRRESNRIGMLGAGGNVTRGPWLAKFELAWKADVRVLRQRDPDPRPFSVDNDRIDSMLGLEYYGRDDLMIALEIVNRTNVQSKPSGTRQLRNRSRIESSLRISRPFFRERMHVTALAVGFGQRLQNGGLVRLSSDWELARGWTLEGGILVFIGGPDDGLGAFDSNDRLYAQITYDF